MWHQAARHLARVDRKLAPLIQLHGPPRYEISTDPLQSLGRAIIWQQLSGAAAGTIYKRFLALYPRKQFPRAKRLLETPVPTLRSVGLSAAKAAALHDLAAKTASGQLPLRRIHQMSDEEVSAALLPVRGIGPWSVDMFLMFALGRPDVLPVGDLGVKKGMQRHFGLRKLPDSARMEALAAPWRPYRSAAAWYMWRIIETP